MASHRINIAIDGYSSCGKSTLARDLALRLGYIYIDTGAMYRAVTLHVQRQQCSVFDRQAVASLLPEITITFQTSPQGMQTILNGEVVEEEIRSMAVAQQVSQIAVIPAVRRAMVHQQKAMARQKGVAMDGRDIGTVVIPDAELKLFVTADMEVRVQRRLLQLLQSGQEAEQQAIRRNLYSRDYIDSTRSDSPLCKAPGAVLIDNSALSPDEQLEMVLALVHHRSQKHR